MADAAAEMSGAEMVLRALKDQGVEVIFGYPCGAVLPIYDALYDFEGLRHVLVRQEAAAGHAAEGYARATGKVGVSLGTSGPGRAVQARPPGVIGGVCRMTFWNLNTQSWLPLSGYSKRRTAAGFLAVGQKPADSCFFFACAMLQ